MEDCGDVSKGSWAGRMRCQGGPTNIGSQIFGMMCTLRIIRSTPQGQFRKAVASPFQHCRLLRFRLPSSPVRMYVWMCVGPSSRSPKLVHFSTRWLHVSVLSYNVKKVFFLFGIFVAEEAHGHFLDLTSLEGPQILQKRIVSACCVLSLTTSVRSPRAACAKIIF